MKRSLNPALVVVIIVLVVVAVVLVGWKTMAGKPGIEQQQQDQLKADMQRNMATGAGGGMKGGPGGGGREVSPPPAVDQ